MTVGHALWPDQLTAGDLARLRPGLPEHLDRQPDILVVGGGILGCATAAACVQAGLGSVVVLEREALGAGASGGAAGLLMPEAHVDTDPPEFVAAMRRSLDAWRTLDQIWPGGVGLQPYDWKGHPQARVNPLFALARLASALPCIATGITATGLTCHQGRVTSVSTSAGELQPGTVVIATGLPPDLPGLEDLKQLPASEVKGHMLCTAPTQLALPEAVRDADLARVIDDGRILVGGTLDVGDSERVVRPGVTAGMWRELVAAWPALDGVPVEYTWACFRPAHADHLPIVDRLPGLSNAWLTTGHYKTGILMAPATGQALADWINTGAAPADMAPFRLSRSSLGNRDQE
ncbi:MAG: FAD-binding oxidoreductase [Chloroflexi bacterium]|nr:FAD-binding oxidoreductase [Chloroflexota bacterium]